MTHFCALTSSRSQSGNKADSFAVPTGIAIQRCKLETFKRLCDLKFAMTATCCSESNAVLDQVKTLLTDGSLFSITYF